MNIRTGKELAAACVDAAKNHKTLYVMGCFGAPMSDSNKKRYVKNHTYNMKPARTAMIQAASADTFGFDCVCLIKGLLWGWSGDPEKTYGGAKYNCNGVPDYSADQLFRQCVDRTADFSDIQVGEAVWMSGHIGVYVGGGLAVECTPQWDNRVQITAVGNLGKVKGYNTRTWKEHGKLPYVTYEEVFPFLDVPENAYYRDAVRWAVQKGITKGTDETHFSPDKPCTRAQIVAMLHRALEVMK